MKFGTVVLQPILNRNRKKNLNFILMTSLTSCLKIIDKMAYWRRLKKGHHEILIFFDFFFTILFMTIKGTSIQYFMQFGAFVMFLLRLIFLEFPLSSAKVAGVTGGAGTFFFFFSIFRTGIEF